MSNIIKSNPSALVEVGQMLLRNDSEMKLLQDESKRMREFIFDGMKKNRLKSLKLDTGHIFTIKDGNRKVTIVDQKKAEKYLEDMSCWKIDSTKLLTIFGRNLKVPPFFKVERGPETLTIMPPKHHGKEEN